MEALEIDRKARSEIDQEVLALQGWVLGVEELNARLLEKVTQQEEGLSILEGIRLGMYPFCIWSMSWFFLSLASELVVLLLELGGRIGSLKQELETAKAAIDRSMEALAKSLEERHALEGELDQVRNVAQLVVSEVFGSPPSTSAPTVQLAEVPDVVRDLITSGLFYRASGVLTSVATYHPNLHFATICIGYANGLSMEDIQTLGESLLPHARLVAEQVSM